MPDLKVMEETEIDVEAKLEELEKFLNEWDRKLKNSPGDPSVRSSMRDYVIPFLRDVSMLLTVLAESQDDMAEEIADAAGEDIAQLQARHEELSLLVRHMATAAPLVQTAMAARALAQAVAAVPEFGSVEVQAAAVAIIEATEGYARALAPAAPVESAAGSTPVESTSESSAPETSASAS